MFPAVLLSARFSVYISLAVHFQELLTSSFFFVCVCLCLFTFVYHLYSVCLLCVCACFGIRWRMNNVSGGPPGAELTDEEKEIINSVLARAAMMESMEQERIE